mmetsp:Transcript_41937/g.112328  ORF Transcript_41937/g.112328 Transcript_41937/m.112328 type:complete len:325 (-) Transcript_41937:2367-3341(-)
MPLAVLVDGTPWPGIKRKNPLSLSWKNSTTVPWVLWRRTVYPIPFKPCPWTMSHTSAASLHSASSAAVPTCMFSCSAGESAPLGQLAASPSRPPRRLLSPPALPCSSSPPWSSGARLSSRMSSGAKLSSKPGSEAAGDSDWAPAGTSSSPRLACRDWAESDAIAAALPDRTDAGASGASDSALARAARDANAAALPERIALGPAAPRPPAVIGSDAPKGAPSALSCLCEANASSRPAIPAPGGSMSPKSSAGSTSSSSSPETPAPSSPGSGAGAAAQVRSPSQSSSTPRSQASPPAKWAEGSADAAAATRCCSPVSPAPLAESG